MSKHTFRHQSALSGQSATFWAFQNFLAEVGDSAGHFHVARSNDRGEFQFIDLEPGKYVLRAAHADYMDGVGTGLRITRENLTNARFISSEKVSTE
jgi:hypothetical protein